jgi:nicotinate dehydrogenase subunit A
VTIRFNLNEHTVELDIDGDVPLLYALRNDLGLNGPRFGCGLGQCGACTVLIDGAPVRACAVRVSVAAGKRVVSLEGLGDANKPHALQQAFIEEQALQCGYCGNGMLIAAAALLAKNPRPTDREIRRALDGYLCRCGAHSRIVKAVARAASAAEQSDDAT